MTRSLKIICSSTSRGWHYFQKVVVSHESPKNFTLWRVFTWVTWRWWETAGQQRAPHHWAEDTPADICFFLPKHFNDQQTPLLPADKTEAIFSASSENEGRRPGSASQQSRITAYLQTFCQLAGVGGGDQILNSSSVASSGLSNLQIWICETLGINMNSMIACYRRMFN